jgi:hypothetical protein
VPEEIMLWVAFIVLLAIWLLGIATAVTLGGFIHLLLVIALTLLLVQFMNRRGVV